MSIGDALKIAFYVILFLALAIMNYIHQASVRFGMVVGLGILGSQVVVLVYPQPRHRHI
jgi:hypothetical protein